MHFLKIWVLKFQNNINHSIFVSEEKEKTHSTQNCIHYNALLSDLKKKYIYIIIYIVQHCDRFFDTFFKYFFFK